MMIANPVAAAAAKPPVPQLATSVKPPTTAPAAAPASGTTPPATGASPAPTGAPKSPPTPAEVEQAKAAVVDKLMATSAADALGTVDAHLAKLATLTVGGGTPQGVAGAKEATALLTDASMMLQHAHVKAMEQLRAMAGELHMRLMSSASGLAYMGGQVQLAGGSKEPIKLADIAAGPIAETKATMADVVAALTPPKTAHPAKDPAAPAAPAAAAPAPGASAAPAAPAAPSAPAAPATPKPVAG